MVEVRRRNKGKRARTRGLPSKKNPKQKNPLAPFPTFRPTHVVVVLCGGTIYNTSPRSRHQDSASLTLLPLPFLPPKTTGLKNEDADKQQLPPRPPPPPPRPIPPDSRLHIALLLWQQQQCRDFTDGTFKGSSRRSDDRGGGLVQGTYVIGGGREGGRRHARIP